MCYNWVEKNPNTVAQTSMYIFDLAAFKLKETTYYVRTYFFLKGTNNF